MLSLFIVWVLIALSLLAVCARAIFNPVFRAWVMPYANFIFAATFLFFVSSMYTTGEVQKSDGDWIFCRSLSGCELRTFITVQVALFLAGMLFIYARFGRIVVFPFVVLALLITVLYFLGESMRDTKNFFHNLCSSVLTFTLLFWLFAMMFYGDLKKIKERWFELAIIAVLMLQLIVICFLREKEMDKLEEQAGAREHITEWDAALSLSTYITFFGFCALLVSRGQVEKIDSIKI